jgi:CxxC-x17-CxxC domain-containing protein
MEKGERKERIFYCTLPENISPEEWKDCEICLYAKCGFSRCFEPNPKWIEQHGICMYEHCIENMPLRVPRDERSCPTFGHDCPGGLAQANKCRAWIHRYKAICTICGKECYVPFKPDPKRPVYCEEHWTMKKLSAHAKDIALRRKFRERMSKLGKEKRKV